MLLISRLPSAQVYTLEGTMEITSYRAKPSHLLVFKFDIHVIRVHDVRFLGGGVSIFGWLLRGVKILMAAGHG
jgi:hypothetical protein